MSSKPNHRDVLKVRPNTGLPNDFVQSNMIICCGEDSDELYRAMYAADAEHLFPDAQVHKYRCYQAWKYQGLTVILSGIGTGCLEPLMFELLCCNESSSVPPPRLVMIGTAGYLGKTGFGKVYLAEASYPVGCAVTLDEARLPLRPHFDGMEQIALPKATDISTDYYYAATPSTDDVRKNKAKQYNPLLRAGIDKQWKAGRLISMETAQFYHFAEVYGPPGTQYVALRGVANLADEFSTQCDNSLRALSTAFREALSLLG